MQKKILKNGSKSAKISVFLAENSHFLADFFLNRIGGHTPPLTWGGRCTLGFSDFQNLFSLEKDHKGPNDHNDTSISFGVVFV